MPETEIRPSLAQEQAEYAIGQLEEAYAEWKKLPVWRWIKRWQARARYRRESVAARHACCNDLKDPLDRYYLVRLAGVEQQAWCDGLGI